jgi:hypothetical protein
MEPEQTGYTHPMCDDCATYLEDLATRFVGPAHRPVGPAHQPKPRRAPRHRTPVCELCTVWRCSHCGWKRRPAWKGEEQVCDNCGRDRGERFPVHHRSGRWYVHNVMKKKV